jgi:hypothetical protein
VSSPIEIAYNIASFSNCSDSFLNIFAHSLYLDTATANHQLGYLVPLYLMQRHKNVTYNRCIALTLCVFILVTATLYSWIFLFSLIFARSPANIRSPQTLPSHVENVAVIIIPPANEACIALVISHISFMFVYQLT